MMSLPMRERELKHTDYDRVLKALSSLPMRERELKPCPRGRAWPQATVAPHAGA